MDKIIPKNYDSTCVTVSDYQPNYESIKESFIIYTGLTDENRSFNST